MEYDYEADYQANRYTPSPSEGSGIADGTILYDDEDYEDHFSGSGSGILQEEEEQEQQEVILPETPRLRATIENLANCDRFSFTIRSVYEQGERLDFSDDSLISANTLCPDVDLNMTEATEDAEHQVRSTSELVSAFHVKEVVYENATNLEISWKQHKNQKTQLFVDSLTDYSDSHSEIFDTEHLSDAYEYVTTKLVVNYCQKYMIKVFLLKSDDVSDPELKWNYTITTSPDEWSALELESLAIEISARDNRGEAFVSWTHQHACIERYRVQITNGPLIGEQMVTPSSDTSAVIRLDLHMFPGMLTLQNCQRYRIKVLPETNQDSILTISRWYKGFKKQFNYISNGQPPNIFSEEESLSVIASSSTISVKMIQVISCGQLTTALSLKTGVEGNEIEVTSIDVKPLDQNSDEVLFEELHPCMSYSLQIIDDQGSIDITRSVKTLKSEEGVLPLFENEVIAWKEESELPVQLEWVDRCSSVYSVIYKRWPDGEEQSVTDITDRSTTNLPNLNPCSLYNFQILADENVLLFEGNFTSNWMDYLAWSVEPNFDAQNLTITWDDLYVCISSYTIRLESDDTVLKGSIEKYSTAQQVIELTVIFQDYVWKQCSNQSLSIRPHLDENFHSKIWEEKNRISLNAFYFTEPLAPGFAQHKFSSPDTIDIKWESSKCHSSYLVTLKTYEEVLWIERTSYSNMTLNDLIPCTQYKIEVRSSSENSTSSNFTETSFTTDHSDEIHLNHTANYYSVIIEAKLLGSDCVDEYEVHLCDFEASRQCWKKKFDTEEKQIFEDLTDGTAYSYQVLGKKRNMEVFISPEYFLKTRKVVNASLEQYHTNSSSFELKIISPLFQDEEDFDWFAFITCIADYGEFSQNFTNSRIIFKDLEAETEYVCSGEFNAFGENLEFDSLTLVTGSGVPEEPTKLIIDEISANKIVLSWSEPNVTNGKIVEYEVNGRASCQEKTDYCQEHCPANMTAFASNISIELDTEAFTQYEFFVRARTSNPVYSKESLPTAIITSSILAKAPVITRIKSHANMSAIVTFSYPCPFEGPVEFSINFSCVDCEKKPDENVLPLNPFTYELVNLQGGFFYDVWITAQLSNCSLENCTMNSERKLVFVDCLFKCRDGTCINDPKAQCNLIPDCPDGSDEENCSCDPPEFFECGNKFCIDGKKKCDGYSDCGDKSDEQDCPDCLRHEFQCEATSNYNYFLDRTHQ